MNARMKEASKLREFMAANDMSERQLSAKVNHMKEGSWLFAAFTSTAKALTVLLRDFDAIEYAVTDSGEIVWKDTNGLCSCLPSKAYRVKPDYALPDLTVEERPRYTNGTWVLIMGRKVRQIVDRSEYGTPHGNYPSWCATKDKHGTVRWISGDADVQELPAKPEFMDWADSYKLTGEVVDCRSGSNGKMWVSVTGFSVNESGACFGDFGGFRWVVEKIATPQRFVNGTWIADKDGNVFKIVDRSEWGDAPYDAPADWCACRDINNTLYWTEFDWDDVQELLPMPNEANLAKLGYVLTMKVADCSKYGHGHLFVTNCENVWVTGTSASKCKGWRWTVEKIATPQKFANGTMLLINGRKIVEVVARELFVWNGCYNQPTGDWCAVREPDGEIMHLDGREGDLDSPSVVQELPPKPTSPAGYELTGKVGKMDGTYDLSVGETWIGKFGFTYDHCESCDKSYASYKWLIREVPHAPVAKDDRSCSDCANYECDNNSR